MTPAPAIVPLGNKPPLAWHRLRPFAQVRWLTVMHTLMVMVCLYVFTQMFVKGGPLMFKFAVGMRYLLWPLILAGAATHIVRRGASDILQPSAIMMPYFCIGVISALISLEPIEAARDLAFWLLVVLAASAAGRQLGERLAGQMLFWGFGIAMILSMLASILLPNISIDQDLRVAGGDWRGAFPGKNWLGWYAGFALITALAVTGIRWPVRAAGLAVAAICLYFARSGGAVAQVMLVTAFLGTLQVMRRLKLSPSLKGLLLGSGTLLVVTAGIVFWDQLLGLLGRDATLTGRTEIWRLYFDRALDSWLLGAGPASFTHRSATTIDLSLALQGYGGIQTPHNMYIATFGEVGILGLGALLVPLFYLAFVQPFRHPGLGPLMLAGFTFSLMISGFGETHEVFGLGIAMFLLMLVRAAIGHDEGGIPLPPAAQPRGETPEPMPMVADPLYSGPRGPIALG